MPALHSHAILASMIGAHREQVTRTLKALARQGLVRKTGAHSLSVLDVAALRRRVATGE